MATLRLTFQELYNEVSKFLGTYGSSGPSGQDLTDAKDTVYAGYRRFLNAYDWSFVKPILKFTTVANTWEYQLPEDFSYFIGPFHFSAGSSYPSIEERSVEDILGMRSSLDHTTYPEYYAIKPGSYSPETGQNFELMFYPTPDSAYTLFGRYKLYPKKLSATTDLPVGTPETDEALKALCLAEAEVRKDEEAGPQSQLAQEILRDAVRADRMRNARRLGRDYPHLSSWQIARGSYMISDVSPFQTGTN